MLHRNLFTLIAVLSVQCAMPSEQDESIVLKEDFEHVESEFLPKGFMVLSGEFTIQTIDNNKVIHLPENPLSDYGVLFGPNAQENLEVQARIWSESRRRLTPRFGVGLNGINGYKLLLVPNKKTVEIWKGNEPVAEAQYEWNSGRWTVFRLKIVKEGNHWLVKGKVWQAGASEPEEWLVQFQDAGTPITGKPSIWGTPYSSKPILFDDILVRTAGPTSDVMKKSE